MKHSVTLLPDDQLAVLKAAYANHYMRRRLVIAIGLLLFCVLFALSWDVGEVKPAVFYAKIGGFFGYFNRLFHLDNGAFVLTDPIEWFWGLRRWIILMGQTLLVSYSATVLGALFAIILSFVQARPLGAGVAPSFLIKRFLEFCRTVPDIVFALIFVIAFGLGPFPGVLAMTIHTTGALGKLFAEIVDNIDMNPVEGLRASGANWFLQVRFAVVPQVLVNYLTYILLRFEINVRGASVMGFVGAGGIGQDLIESIRKFYYSDISAILLLIIVTVYFIDYVTEKLRHSILRMKV